MTIDGEAAGKSEDGRGTGRPRNEDGSGLEALPASMLKEARIMRLEWK